MCPPGCHHNGFMVTPELGHSMYGYLFIYFFFSGNEIPMVLVSVPKFDVLKKGEEIMIACNVTRVKDLSWLKLKRISWFKDGLRVQTVRCPLPNVPEDTLQPLVVKDGGNYSCILELLLQGGFLHMVSDFVVIRCKFNAR